MPGLPEREAVELRASLGFDDRLIVRGEHCADWAIAGGPAIRDQSPLDRAGLPVRFMSNIRPYRERKVRVLNGAHTAIAAVGPLVNCRTVLEAGQHPAVGAYLRHLLHDEVLPAGSGDRAELRQYAAAILDRFHNPALQHLLADTRLNALVKWRTRNLPVVLDAWSQGRRAELGGFAFACLLGRRLRCPARSCAPLPCSRSSTSRPPTRPASRRFTSGTRSRRGPGRRPPAASRCWSHSASPRSGWPT